MQIRFCSGFLLWGFGRWGHCCSFDFCHSFCFAFSGFKYDAACFDAFLILFRVLTRLVSSTTSTCWEFFGLTNMQGSFSLNSNKHRSILYEEPMVNSQSSSYSSTPTQTLHKLSIYNDSIFSPSWWLSANSVKFYKFRMCLGPCTLGSQLRLR